MKKEVGIYLFLGLLAVGVFLTLYYLNPGITGFAVFEQNNAAAFNEGVYENLAYDSNSSAVVLSPNQTSGAYTSKVFDAGSSVNWNNLTFVGSNALTFQVRACASATCANESFSSVANLNNLNLTTQYLQYKVTFNASASPNETLSLSSVSVGSSPIPVPVQTSVSISEPSGTKSASTGIPLNFSVVGEGLTCWYDVHDASDGAVIKDNTSISGCSSLTFDLGAGEGSYTLNVYANGSSGFSSDSSAFSVDLSSTTTTEEEETNESTVQVPVVPVAPVTQAEESPKVTQITASDIESFTVIPGSIHDIKWTVRNTGTEPVSACTLKSQGDFASWVSASETSVNLNTGDSHEFTLLINVPEDSEDGSYSLSVSVDCAEADATKEFALNVEKKKLEFDIIGAQRTRTDRVRVVYSLEELTGEDQEVEVQFSILDSGNAEVANFSQNRSIDANATDEFSANIPINDSLQGNFSLSAKVNSEVYTTTVLEPIVLGTPVGGFAIFGQGLGTGSILILVAVVLALVVVIFVARRMRKAKKP